MSRAKLLLVLVIGVGVGGCAKPRPIKLPPITDGWQNYSAVKHGYLVQPGDTLYSIAWAFGQDFRQLATLNQLTSPYRLRRGQRLRLTSQLYSSPSKISTKYSWSKLAKNGSKLDESSHHLKYCSSRNLSQSSSTPSETATFHSTYSYVSTNSGATAWHWPTKANLQIPYRDGAGGNRGLDFAGKLGQAILASNHGIVVYSGTGIRAYGKLIIIKHDEHYLSAYAYNQKILVHEGDEVQKGQIIANMGYNREGKAALHFEIRRDGKPIDPLPLLPKT